MDKDLDETQPNEPVPEDNENDTPEVRVGWIDEINNHIQQGFQNLSQQINEALAGNNQPNLTETIQPLLKPLTDQITELREAMNQPQPKPQNEVGDAHEKTPTKPEIPVKKPFLFKPRR